MTDYTKNTGFTAKDALITGNPSKKLKGSELDSEFDEIASSSATKEDKANKGVPSGYASLDGGGLVPTTQLPASTTSAQGAVELATTAETVAGSDAVRAVTPAGLAGAGLVPEYVAYKTASTARSSTTTPTDDPHLVLSALPTGTYWFEAQITYASAGGGAGIKYNFANTGTILSYAGLHVTTQNGTAPLSVFQTAHARSESNFANTVDHTPAASGFDVSILVRGVIRVTSAGDFKLQWAQSSSSGTATTLQAYSFLRAKRMGA